MPIPSQRKWDDEFNKRREYYLRRIRRYYNAVIKEVSQMTVGVSLNKNDEFYWRNYPALNEKMNALIKELYTNVYGDSVMGINTGWQLAVDKNNELVKYVFGTTLNELSTTVRNNYLSNNGGARRNFLYRKDGKDGLRLSQKVWRNTRQFKTELELALEVGIGKGNSAQTIARNITGYLNDPDRLYRRVRDKENGILRLSKAGKAYNPGQGRYRSSYKNAMRLARNEINFSYEGSNTEKRKQLDFIVGVRIQTTPGHDPSSDKGAVKCIDLQGDYPKNFDFTYKWHVNCLCISTPILKTRGELDKDTEKILEGEQPDTPSTRQVDGMPVSYKNWQTQYNKDLTKMKNQPRFIQQNKKLIDGK